MDAEIKIISPDWFWKSDISIIVQFLLRYRQFKIFFKTPVSEETKSKIFQKPKLSNSSYDHLKSLKTCVGILLKQGAKPWSA